LQSKIAGKLCNFTNHRPRQTAAAVLGQHEHAHPADVSLPAAQLLMQGGVADDFAVRNREQRKVPAEINILTPIADDRQFGYAMFDEHALLFRHREEELMKLFFVILAQGTQSGLKFVLEDNFFRELLNFKFERHSACDLGCSSVPKELPGCQPCPPPRSVV